MEDNFGFQGSNFEPFAVEGIGQEQNRLWEMHNGVAALNRSRWTKPFAQSQIGLQNRVNALVVIQAGEVLLAFKHCVVYVPITTVVRFRDFPTHDGSPACRVTFIFASFHSRLPKWILSI